MNSSRTIPTQTACIPSAASPLISSASNLVPSPWSVDRWGRLIAGFSILLITLLTLLHHPYWLLGGLVCGLNLAFSALTDRCALRNILLRLGAREREDLFFPGGRARTLSQDFKVKQGTPPVRRDEHGQ